MCYVVVIFIWFCYFYPSTCIEHTGWQGTRTYLRSGHVLQKDAETFGSVLFESSNLCLILMTEKGTRNLTTWEIPASRNNTEFRRSGVSHHERRSFRETSNYKNLHPGEFYFS